MPQVTPEWNRGGAAINAQYLLEPAWAYLKDWSESFHRIVSTVLIPALNETFTSEGRGLWRQLQPSTVRRRGSDHPILYVTGELRSSFNFEDVTKDTLMWGSLIPLAAYHQYGTGRTRPSGRRGVKSSRRFASGSRTGMGGGMPPRPILGFRPDTINAVTTEIKRNAELGFRAAGFSVIPSVL